jgi:hypothetical protein
MDFLIIRLMELAQVAQLIAKNAMMQITAQCATLIFFYILWIKNAIIHVLQIISTILQIFNVVPAHPTVHNVQIQILALAVQLTILFII